MKYARNVDFRQMENRYRFFYYARKVKKGPNAGLYAVEYLDGEETYFPHFTDFEKRYDVFTFQGVELVVKRFFDETADHLERAVQKALDGQEIHGFVGQAPVSLTFSSLFSRQRFHVAVDGYPTPEDARAFSITPGAGNIRDVKDAATRFHDALQTIAFENMRKQEPPQDDARKNISGMLEDGFLRLQKFFVFYEYQDGAMVSCKALKEPFFVPYNKNGERIVKALLDVEPLFQTQ